MQIDESFLSDFFWHITFVLLLVLTLISSLIATFTREKTYLYYALYTFFLLSYILLKTPYIDLQKYLLSIIHPAYNFYSQTLFYSFYIYFFLYFLDIENYFSKLTKRFKTILFWVIVISTLVFLTAVFTDTKALFNNYFIFVYTPFNLVIGIIAIVKASKTKGYLKYYFVLGSIIYLCLAITALALSYSNYDHETTLLLFGKPFYLYPILFFYIGVFIEQIVFSLGLSFRVKKINDQLQRQYERNKRINKKLNKNLELRNTEIVHLTKKAEEERLAQMKTLYESKINKLQLSLLHSQMNPHFIFNVLNSIKVYLIDNDKEKAVYYLNKFSKLIRKILDSSREETITLEEEIDLIKLYIGIEKIRFEDTINFYFDISKDLPLKHILIPPLMLQPFVENAIWHGLSPLKEGKKLVIKAKHTQEGVILRIIDNGVGREATIQQNQKKTIKKHSLGLKIIQERLNYFNKKEKLNYQFEIIDLKDEKDEATGTEVRFLFYES